MSNKIFYYKSNIGYNELPFVMRDYFELIDIEETCQCRPKQKCANEQEISTKLADEQKEPEYDEEWWEIRANLQESVDYFELNQIYLNFKKRLIAELGLGEK